MDFSNENKDDARSKIEKIRIDLENKLAALEKAKLISKDNDDNILNSINQSKITQTNQEDNFSFLDNIIDIEKNAKIDTVKSENEITLELNDEIEILENKIEQITNENVKSIKSEIKIDSNIVAAIKTTESSNIAKPTKPIETKKDIKVLAKEKKVVPLEEKPFKKEVAKNEVNQFSPTESTKSNSKVLIYSLALLSLIAFSFLGYKFFNKNSKDKNNILTEYENRRFNDSIKLADANSQLLDIQNQQYLDSIAFVNQIILEDKSEIKSDKKKASKSKIRLKPRFNNINEKAILINKKAEKSHEKEMLNIKSKAIASNDDLTKKTIEEDKVADSKESNIKKESISSKKNKTETILSIEKSPIFPGCESQRSESLKKKCLMSSLSKFVAKKFNNDLTQDLGLEEGRKRINVSFVIDQFGGVTVLKVRGQHKVLEKEAIRVVESLPKMTPGIKNGKRVPVKYNLPIIYNVEY